MTPGRARRGRLVWDDFCDKPGCQADDGRRARIRSRFRVLSVSGAGRTSISSSRTTAAVEGRKIRTGGLGGLGRAKSRITGEGRPGAATRKVGMGQKQRYRPAGRSGDSGLAHDAAVRSGDGARSRHAVPPPQSTSLAPVKVSVPGAAPTGFTLRPRGIKGGSGRRIGPRVWAIVLGFVVAALAGLGLLWFASRAPPTSQYPAADVPSPWQRPPQPLPSVRQGKTEVFGVPPVGSRGESLRQEP